MSEPIHTQPIRIAIAAASEEKAVPYQQWLHRAASVASIATLELVVLTPAMPVSEAVEQMNRCSGLLLTGGKDIHPQRYGLGHRAAECRLEPQRDELEFAVFDAAQKAKKPILGICRGCQLINVALGGSLYVDIPTDLRTSIEHRKQNQRDSEHPIAVVGGSLLFKITGEVEGIVNSAHHQAIHQPGRGLTVTAYSPDNVAEAVEWESLYGSSFLLGVQWHPERMAFDNPFSGKIATHFLFEVESFALLLGAT